MKEEDDIEEIILNYFREIFTSSSPTDLDLVLDSVEPYINSNMTQLLEVALTKDKVLASLHQIHPTKALGLDGTPALFFQKFWHVINTDVLQTVLAILNNNMDPSFINNTHIILIPKIENPKTTRDYRPISLCNVIFKLVTKTLTNRLKFLISSIKPKVRLYQASSSLIMP